MEKEPFLMLFKQPVPAVDPALIEEDFSYSRHEQLNITSDGQLLWRASKGRTCYHTAGKWIPPHRTAKGKYVPGRSKPSKTDKRAGK